MTSANARLKQNGSHDTLNKYDNEVDATGSQELYLCNMRMGGVCVSDIALEACLLHKLWTKSVHTMACSACV